MLEVIMREECNLTPKADTIKGLYMAGYQAFSAIFMGGIPTAIKTGKLAAEAVLRNANPAEEILIP
jgi:hypothetical protein